MHSKVIEFINDNEDLIDTADWDKLFDRMYIAFKSNTWIYPILETLEEGLPEYKEELEEMKITKYRDKVVELLKDAKVMHSSLLLGLLRHSFGLTTDEMRLALESDSRFKVKNLNRYDYEITLLEI